MAEWKGASGIPTIAADKVQRKSDTQLVITIPPPAKGDAVLTLITPAGSKVSTKVTVL